MASRTFRPPLGALEVDVVELFATLTIGTSGSISASGGDAEGKGFASFTKESAAGKYTLELEDTYQELLWAGITLEDATASDSASVGTLFRVFSENVAGVSADPTIVIQAYASDDGAAANCRDGAVVKVCLKLRNSTVS